MLSFDLDYFHKKQIQLHWMSGLQHMNYEETGGKPLMMYNIFWPGIQFLELMVIKKEGLGGGII